MPKERSTDVSERLFNHPLFFPEVLKIQKQVLESLSRLDEKCFSWIDSCLEDARKVLCQEDVHILPKTPSAKERSRRVRKVENDEGDKPSTKGRTTRKKLLVDSDGESDDENTPQPGKGGRATRSRAATTSRAKNTRAAAAKKAKSRSQEPIFVIEDCVKESMDTNQNEQSVLEVHEEIETWMQPANTNIVLPKFNTNDNDCKTPTNKPLTDFDKTPVNKVRTPIHQNFSLLNVKEKVHAYEEVLLISPVVAAIKKKNSLPKVSQEQNSNSQKTPENATQAITKTPDTVVQHKHDAVISRVSTDSGHSSTEDVHSLPRESTGEAGGKSRPSVTSVKKGVRKSLRTSLHVLPSKRKISAVQPEEEVKPVRTRTRLRLKKKKVDESSVEDEVCEMETDAASSADSSVPSVTTETHDHIDTPAEPSNEQENLRRSTRLSARKSVEETDVEMETQDSLPEKQPVPADSKPEGPVEEVVPAMTRSTRTKTRAAQQAVAVTETTAAQDTDQSSQDSAIEDVPSTGGETPRRLTRTMLKNSRVAEVTASNTPTASPHTPARSTRTKTRKRQHEEGSDTESQTRRPKRSCAAPVEGTPGSQDDGNTPNSEDDSSDSDMLSPPSSGRPMNHPKSFLNNLNPAKPPPNLVPGTGLVKSFITRNSPAPKQTMKELQEKRKKDLLEKQRLERERMKKREEEARRKMDEMRKKREERAKKVQELRERQERKAQEERSQLEKTLAEKREKTLKMREQRAREEKEKQQKLRVQKMEEAEERRKQEEQERQKKLQEQLEQEKFHEDLMARKREHEEKQRQQKMEEEKRLAAERLQAVERERERERERLLQQEQERKKEWQKKKEERQRQIAAERAEKERQELEKKREREAELRREMERIREQERLRQAEQDRLKAEEKKRDLELKKMLDKHNSQLQAAPATYQTAAPATKPTLPKPNLNKTHSLENKSKQNDSYEMTPDRVQSTKCLTEENYGIDDLDSGDETDNEDAPRKPIPDWAQGHMLKTQLIMQHYQPPDLDTIFSIIDPPDLNVLFTRKKPRFNKRTSSAHWDTPILKPGLLGRV